MNYGNSYLFIIYSGFCKIYQFIATLYENNFLRNKSFNKNSKGFFKYKNLDLDSIEIKNVRTKFVNPYLSVREINNENLQDLTDSIFNKEFTKFIEKETGFKYSIDFVIFYDRHHIPENIKEKSTLKQYYSYKWHFDKPNSKNVLKIILPVNLEEEDASLVVFDKNRSKLINQIDIKKKDYFKFTGCLNNIYGFMPSICWHKDQIPKKQKICSQIMFQLNPWREWALNVDFLNKKPFINRRLNIWTNEPKFRWITLNFNKRVKLNFN
tara:strand:- start:73 stop:873 length:801 start_codon:yes stop_codon:yes gene_type:complete